MNIGNDIAKAYIKNQKAVTALMNEYGAKIDATTTRRQKVKRFVGMLKSNEPFQSEFVSKYMANQFKNFAPLAIAGKIGASAAKAVASAGSTAGSAAKSGINAGGLTNIVGAIGSFFGGGGADLTGGTDKSDELYGKIIDLEMKKQEKKESNAPYWIAGGAIALILGITTVVIIKNRK